MNEKLIDFSDRALIKFNRRKSFTLFLLGCLIFLLLFFIRNLLEEEKFVITKSENLEGVPITITTNEKPSGYLVVIAHGFAGSSTFMRSIAVALARAGHFTVRFDFYGHGESANPFYGDVMRKTGPTRRFINQLNLVIDEYKKRYNYAKVVLVGHSMASDIIVRATQNREDIASVIAISSYTGEILKKNFPNFLVVNGEWEKGLIAKTKELFNANGISGVQVEKIYGKHSANNARKLSVISGADHVGILYAKKTQTEILNWITPSKEGIENKTNRIGVWALGIFASLWFIFFFISSLLAKNKRENFPTSKLRFSILVFMILIPVPLFLPKFQISLINFPVHNHIFNHLFIISCLSILLSPVRFGEKWIHTFNLRIIAFLLFYFIFGLGYILNFYVSQYYISGGRVEIFLILMIVTIPICLITQAFYEASKNGSIYANLFKTVIICSLIYSVYLDPPNLFLLVYAILLFISFNVVFGFLSNFLNNKIRSFVSIGIVNGIVLSLTFTSAIPLYI